MQHCCRCSSSLTSCVCLQRAIARNHPLCTDLVSCRLPLAVEPSTLPVALQLLRDGTPLPTRVVEGEDGPSQVAVLEGLPAGSSGGRGAH